MNFEKSFFETEGIILGIPEGCIGFTNNEENAWVITHTEGSEISERTAWMLMNETFYGEYDYDNVISAVKVFDAFDMGCDKVDFTKKAVFMDFGGELYAEMANKEHYIGLNGENEDGHYSYDLHPTIKFKSKHILSFYWMDCNDDVEFFNYVLVCRMCNVSSKNGTFALFCEFLLPFATWKEEISFLLSKITCGGRHVMASDELDKVHL